MTNTLTEGLRVNVTVEQREALEQIAASEQRSVAFIVRRAIREYLERHPEAEEAAA